MVSYHISAPMKNGNHWVVEIKEYHGGSVLRSTKVQLKQIVPFLKAVFHGELHEKIKFMVEKEEREKRND